MDGMQPAVPWEWIEESRRPSCAGRRAGQPLLTSPWRTQPSRPPHRCDKATPGPLLSGPATRLLCPSAPALFFLPLRQ